MAALKHYFIRRPSLAGVFGNFASSTGEFGAEEQDILFVWQVGGLEFERLTVESLERARIVDSRHIANQLFKACQRTGIIDPVTGQPDTTKIDRTIVNKLPVISRAYQRMLVNMLFFWEEELVRWRLLSEEEHALEMRLKYEPDVSEDEKIHIFEALQVFDAKKRVRPSLRDHSGQPNAGELPAYRA